MQEQCQPVWRDVLLLDIVYEHPWAQQLQPLMSLANSSCAGSTLLLQPDFALPAASRCADTRGFLSHADGEQITDHAGADGAFLGVSIPGMAV
jgi:hypothetical protein